MRKHQFAIFIILLLSFSCAYYQHYPKTWPDLNKNSFESMISGKYSNLEFVEDEKSFQGKLTDIFWRPESILEPKAYNPQETDLKNAEFIYISFDNNYLKVEAIYNNKIIDVKLFKINEEVKIKKDHIVFTDFIFEGQEQAILALRSSLKFYLDSKNNLILRTNNSGIIFAFIIPIPVSWGEWSRFDRVRN